MPSSAISSHAVDAFIARWTACEGGAERANYQMFLSELCDVIGVPRPEPSGQARERNDYVFERAVRPRDSDATAAPKRIDLYRKNAFILEAKQSRLPDGRKVERGELAPVTDEPADLGRRSISRGWDVMMKNARRQAESYVFLLDADHPAPPFIIVCDVGHCLELYADFSGTGRAYSHFPDRNGFRIYLHDLREEKTRALLARVWQEPHSLDPSKEAARVTRDIAKRLAGVSKALEERGCDAEDVAHFLMRCLFTMFAEDVALLPPDSFKALLQKSVDDPTHFPHRLKALWEQMDKGDEFSHVIETRVRHFNGGLFRDTTVFPLGREEIGELLAAANYSWTEVDPAIFGTLLEQALDKKERRKLGAHYTPRAYVQRLVDATVMEPLREDWQNALRKAEHAKETGDEKAAIAIVRAFHRQLCATRVLDPACGTGNFLYVSLELMKKLEGEVLETLAQLGEPESMGLDRETVDPHQFLGLELNPRAAAIAELVVWIGYLQQHYRNRTGHPSEPILRAFENINFGRRQGYDAVLTWDGYPVPHVVEKDGKRVETYPTARRPAWPDAEFIVGNPPFIGGKDLRARLGDTYTEALWSAHRHMNDSADFVMYWWDRAAEFLTAKNSPLRRFGFVTTNSITQEFSRRVMKKRMEGKTPVSLVMAIPDHPWTKAAADSAAVRIAMTVAEKGERDGVLYEVMRESGLDTDEPVVELVERAGRVNVDLTVGTDVGSVAPLLANEGLCSRGVSLHGSGFIVTPEEAAHLGLGKRSGLEKHIRPYRNGRDLTATPRGVMVIDLFGLKSEEVRQSYPEVYQHILSAVKPERDSNNRDTYRLNWWTFGESRRELRPALDGLPRYIATVETAKHRIFQFLDASILPDNMLVAIASSDPLHLGFLSSKLHMSWALGQGGTLEDRPRYNKSSCFDPFPFPDPPEALRAQIRAVAEELDAFRKARQAEHPKLTLTQMYNVLEKLKAMEAAPSPSGLGSSRSNEHGASSRRDPRHKAGDDAGTIALTPDEERIKDEGLIGTLKSYHGDLDRLVFQAYGWPDTLSDEEILERLVALNAERAREEASGLVRWLRPDYQIPRFAKGAAAAKTGELDLGATVVTIDRALPDFPKDRHEDSLAVEHALLSAGRPMDAAALARGFRRGGKRIEPRIEQALTTLVRYGRITMTADGRYLARKAA
ncbi:class I SAM-dependent DNA methyltransferase [Microvirga terrae]|uniref:site-specific DNA-methyltransferase (adenine-specific) n=1 Tax=Microvirga terrae TaxID=2740529 RepID=A0ABY5RYI0_9HYPH|nr:class I SAM-dependent DNA methyltransferase [Microvirga terrae]UVF20827.1 class I SAM-dependent DNA methyltransferase [Microvirga terrae]